MRILVLTPAIYDTSPGQRFRIEQWARYLERDDFEFEFEAFESRALHDVLYLPGQYGRKASLMLQAMARRLRSVLTAGHFDAVYLVREASLIGPAVIERLLSWRRVPIIYDFDDPVWLPYKSPVNGFFSKLKFPSKTASICRRADQIVTGNHLLANWALSYNRNVDVVPSTIDLQQYPVKTTHRTQGDAITLGWTGSHSTLPFLNTIVGPLNALAKTHAFRLVVIAHEAGIRIPGAQFEVVGRKWIAEREAMDLHEIDIGLGPFPDSGWTPWRCHGKVLQYMAVGLPCVVSNVGILPDYITDGQNGMLAESEDQWVDRIRQLMAAPSLRQTFGLAGRETIEREYSGAVWASRLGEILKSTVSGKKHLANASGGT